MSFTTNPFRTFGSGNQCLFLLSSPTSNTNIIGSFESVSQYLPNPVSSTTSNTNPFRIFGSGNQVSSPSLALNAVPVQVPSTASNRLSCLCSYCRQPNHKINKCGHVDFYIMNRVLRNEAHSIIISPETITGSHMIMFLGAVYTMSLTLRFKPTLKQFITNRGFSQQKFQEFENSKPSYFNLRFGYDIYMYFIVKYYFEPEISNHEFWRLFIEQQSVYNQAIFRDRTTNDSRLPRPITKCEDTPLTLTSPPVYCSICMNNVSSNFMVKIQCNHEICKDCLKTLISSNQNSCKCPFCRETFKMFTVKNDSIKNEIDGIQR
jgi:hypothetical protein